MQKINHVIQFIKINKTIIVRFIAVLFVMVLSVILIRFFVNKPIPKPYDNNLEHRVKALEGQNRLLEIEVSKLNSQIRQQEVIDSLLEKSVIYNINKIRTETDLKFKLYEQKRIDILNGSIDETVIGLRTRLSSKGNPK